jgi:hypothetical protein
MVLKEREQVQTSRKRSFIYGIFASKEIEASIWYFKDREACYILLPCRKVYGTFPFLHVRSTMGPLNVYYNRSIPLL